MSIQSISSERLRRMGDQEGLVLQGCGGDPQEWLDGINQILTDEGILKKGARFEEAYTFRHEGLTCMLFPFKEDIELDMRPRRSRCLRSRRCRRRLSTTASAGTTPRDASLS